MYEKVYTCIYKEKIVREHLTGPQHYPDNGLVSGTKGEVSRNQEEALRSSFKVEKRVSEKPYYDYAVPDSIEIRGLKREPWSNYLDKILPEDSMSG
ncbi:hypothetical protein AVEN_50806-1 [Araneus ventricosus]|uniref:Uncharacterized protein n=1 Tax=Araneus ventricosus TaxID=182803 RepID=A0A4Y2IWU6_ARAVE|nr:hypothetical protein AVEN_50806-1 [Araneus ventricosus]